MNNKPSPTPLEIKKNREIWGIKMEVTFLFHKTLLDLYGKETADLVCSKVNPEAVNSYDAVVKERDELKEFLDQIVYVSTKFIDKVESGKARSKETYQDLIAIRAKAKFLIGEQGDIVWYLQGNGKVYHTTFNEGAYDLTAVSMGNCFKTEEEANHVLAILKARATIINYIREKGWEWKPDWNNYNQDKWYIFYNHNKKEYGLGYRLLYKVCYVLPYLQLMKQSKEIIAKFTPELNVLFGVE